MNRTSSLHILGGLVAATTLAVGCATWKAPKPTTETDSTDAIVDTPSQHPVIEVEFVNLLVEQQTTEAALEIWQWVDETRVDLEARSDLLENGLRVGFVTNSDAFRQRIEKLRFQGDAIDEFLAQASVASEVSHGLQRIPMRYAKRYELPVRQPIEGNHVVLASVDGETIGRTLHRAQYLLALKTHRSESPQRITLNIRPEIQHGQMRPKWVSSDSAIRIDTRRETWSFEDLEFDVSCRLGDTLVIGADGEPRGMAKNMLTGEGSDHGHQQALVLIRIAQLPEIDL